MSLALEFKAKYDRKNSLSNRIPNTNTTWIARDNTTLHDPLFSSSNNSTGVSTEKKKLRRCEEFIHLCILD